MSGLCQIHGMVTGVPQSADIDLLPYINQPNRISHYVNQHHIYQIELKRFKSNHHFQSFLSNINQIMEYPSQTIAYILKVEI